MNISNELLAAYSEGNVTNDERKAVRQYLTEHPQELESVMMMMDEDYELEPGDDDEKSDYLANPYVTNSFHDIALCAAAFVPPHVRQTGKELIDTARKKGSFNHRLDTLLDDIGV